jgi:hypothetical protein
MRLEGYKPKGEGKRVHQNEEDSWIYRRFHGIGETFSRLAQILNAGLTFGDGTLIDNVAGKWMTYNTNVTPNTDDPLVHNLGVVPVGYLITKSPGAGWINTGVTPWTTTTIYLRCSSPNQVATIFILVPPRTVI